MAMEKRGLHMRLQEYCDCYLETEPLQELETLSKGGAAADVTDDPEEDALKFLSVAILYGLKENARKISFSAAGDGETRINVKASGSYKLPAPSRHMTDKMFEVMRSITHLEEDKAKEPLSLGIRSDRVELKVKFDRSEDSDEMTLSFPKL
jgi:hypothetical protein